MYKLLLTAFFLLVSFNSLAMKRAADGQSDTPKAKRLKIIDEERKLDQILNNLEKNEFIKKSEIALLIDEDVDVDKDELRIGSESCDEMGIIGIGSYHAVCAIGRNVSKTRLGLAHVSSALTPNSVLEKLRQELIELGYTKDQIEFYIVGGNNQTNNITNLFLKLSDSYRILGAKFNPLNLAYNDNSNATINILLSPDGILFSENNETSYGSDSEIESL